MGLTRQEDIERRKQIAQTAATHAFESAELLMEAITHRTYTNERNRDDLPDNDRLEFVGDSVLDLIVAEYVYQEFPDFDSGEMTKLRAAVVNEKALAAVARELSLGEVILLGVGESRMGGADKDSVLADAYEALLGAVYFDGGLEAVRTMVARDLFERIRKHSRRIGQRDSKSLLQEYCAKHHWSLPDYEVIDREGPDHDTIYRVRCTVSERAQCEGLGRSIKRAEQKAARTALEALSRAPDGEGESS